MSHSRQEPVFVRSGEAVAVLRRARTAYAVVAAFEYDGGYGDPRLGGDEVFEFLVAGVALDQAESVPVAASAVCPRW